MKKRNVPWWIWVAVAAAFAVLFSMLSRETGPEVYVVGAGAIAELRRADAPAGMSLRLRTKKQESIGRTTARVTKVLGVWPDTLVVGFDTSDLTPENGGIEAAQEAFRYFLQTASRTDTHVYVVGFMPGPDATPEAIASASVMNAWWRVEICGRSATVCIEPPLFTNDPEDARERRRDAIEHGLAGRRLLRGEPSSGEPNT